jgi:magnesium chelatase subunit D
LAVEVVASADPGERAEAVRRRLAFDADPDEFVAAWTEREDALRDRLRDARPARLPDELLAAVSALCASVGAEGLHADLVLCRGAVALAGWEGRSEATAQDVRRVAPLALGHRRRRSPFEDPGIAPEELDQALHEALAPEGDGPPPKTRDERGDDPPAVVRLAAARAKGEGSGRRSTVEGPRGRLVGDRRVDGPIGSIAVGATAQAAALRRAGDPDAAPIERTDLREAVREQRAGNLLVLAVDASGSMGVESRVEAVRGAVLGLLVDAYQRRDRVALVTFSGDGAEVVLRPTSSVEVARARLQSLAIGGRTPLAAGLAAALDLATAATAGATDHRPLIVLVSDGRATAATGGEDPVAAAHDVAAAIARRGIDAVVIDAETGSTRLGLAAELASAMSARCLTLAELTAGSLEQTLRSL